MSKLLNTPARPLLAGLDAGTPLEAAKSQSALLGTPLGAADIGALRAVLVSGDRLARALALRPLARWSTGSDIDRTLRSLAASDDSFEREQAVWALGDRPGAAASVRVAGDVVAAGGFPAMLAQLAVERWASVDPSVVTEIARALAHVDDGGARARLVETASIADHAETGTLLAGVLRAAGETDAVRAAAARGLAARPDASLLTDLARAGAEGGPELRFACARALLALRAPCARAAAYTLAIDVSGSNEPFHRLLDAHTRQRSTGASGGRAGFRVAQVFLQGRIDAELTNAGAGDGGGLATLLVHLGRALGAEPEIGSVVTIARALAEPETGWRHAELSESRDAVASIERVPFGPAGSLPAAEMWEHRLELERALQATLDDLGGVDVAHLRFADAGAFAAARICRRRGIPVVFTAAPDPHAIVDGAERRGELTRDTFPDADLSQHYLFRTHLVERLLGQADAVALLPRPLARPTLRRLIGLPFAEVEEARVHTIAEGISLAEVDRAADELARACQDGALPSVAHTLLDHIASLPPHRHGLPLLVSVGRLHRVKGLPLLVEAWAGDDDLHRSLNLVLVGGDLERPEPEEAIVLDQIAEVRTRMARAGQGLVLLGHRANGEVATVLRLARTGLGPLVEAGGVYACASQKEEFGVALLEAMATGLAVVAPDSGGPATYVREGVTGFLADTTSIASLRGALRRATAARLDEQRSARASELVRSRYTIEAMAESLTAVYATVAQGAERVAA